MLQNSIFSQDDDPHLENFFSQVRKEQIERQQPIFDVKMVQVNTKQPLFLQFYQDFVINKTQKNLYCLFLDGQIFFQVDENEGVFELLKIETQKRLIFHTQNQYELKKCYEYFKIRCPQIGFMDKFQLIKEIGVGKNSTVFAVRRKRDSVTFAAKIQSYKSNLREEIQILSMLDHPNIIYFRQFFIEKDNNVYILLDYEDGGSLRDFMHTTQLTSEKKAKVVKDMLNALEYLRLKNIVHRDLKLENILYSKTEGTFKIGDFGYAKLNQSKVEKIVGTPGYIAPQLFKGENKTDIKSDIYSMGLVFFEIFTGIKFFEGQTSKQILNNNRRNSDEKWSTVGKEQLGELERKIIKVMIEQKKTRRKNSYEILKSNVFNKFTKIYGVDYKSSVTTDSPSKGNQIFEEEETFDLSFMSAVKKLLKIRSSSN